MLEFIKMHGIGNDYIYIDCFQQPVPENISELTINLSDRNTGIGSDGVVLILPSDIATCSMKMYNADGSEGKMCGNAIRCVGKYMYENGISTATKITVETLSGIRDLQLHVVDGKVNRVTVNMGIAEFATNNIPMICNSKTFIGQEITINNTTYRRSTAVAIGNPHLVIHHANVDNINLDKIGKHFELHAAFPERVNTEFVEIIAPNVLRMRVWERGSGETLACGTGACAVAAAFAETLLVNRSLPITVQLRGGTLMITYKEDRTVLMEGDVKEVFRGSIDI